MPVYINHKNFAKLISDDESDGKSKNDSRVNFFLSCQVFQIEFSTANISV